MPHKFLELAKEKIIVFDGAMGTMIQKYNLGDDDYQGKKGCSEILNISRPDVIKEIHTSYFEVGCDVIETNTFGGNQMVLNEYGLADRDYELNKKSAEIAKKIANDFSTPENPRFVAGSIGPGTKLPSLLHISFDELKIAYKRQVNGLIDGGVDILTIETAQDLLQVKSALVAIFEVFKEKKVKLPVITQVTMEPNGKMLVGSDMLTAIVSLSPFPIDVLGLNCALGPKEMKQHLEIIGNHWDRLISVLPNAGMPKVMNDKTVYDLKPQEFALDLKNFTEEIGVNIVGGCCGTSPDHIKILVESVHGITPKTRKPVLQSSASSLYTSVAFDTEPKPLIIGERMNTNGSKKFREYVLDNNIDGMLGIAREQEKEQAHILDVSVAYTGLPEKQRMSSLVEKLNTDAHIPLMIDSTNSEVIEEALKRIAGKAVINSITLENEGNKLHKILSLCKKYGAAVVALTIDQDGMAKTCVKKTEIARKIYRIATEEYNIPKGDIFFDMLTFTLGSGDLEYRKSAIETLNAIKEIKKEIPGVNTILGLSNVSFGLDPYVRTRFNSIFLHYAIEAGLDAAILHAGKIIPLHKIHDEERILLKNLIFDIFQENENPIFQVLEYYKSHEVRDKETQKKTVLPVEDRLKKRIIDGTKTDIEKDLEECLQTMPALDIINTVLLKGMKTVGDLFVSGEIQLPFVLKSAETMKSAVKYLEPLIEKDAGDNERGKMVIATVKGDVHDIGKNLVDIILSNNGFKVINIGIKQNIEAILEAYEKHGADVIGMSGLLVQSTLEMKRNLELMNERNITPPVILGGAALNKNYVETELQKIYKGEVYYAKDAFDGLHVLSDIFQKRNKNKSYTEEKTKEKVIVRETEKKYKPLIEPVHPPIVPFWGTKIVNDINIRKVVPFLNKTSLYLMHWGLKKGNTPHEEYQQILKEADERLESLIQKSETMGLITPKIVYGYFPCNSENEQLHIYENLESSEPLTTFSFPRQIGKDELCINDYFFSIYSGEKDIAIFHLVTIGNKASKESEKLFSSNEYQDYLYWHGFSVEMAEALAEYSHKEIRKELGIDIHDSKNIQELLIGKYQGCRYSFGYPACPDLSDQKKLCDLLQPEKIGVQLTESFELVPEQSTSALIVHHPEAKYFAI